MKSGYNSLHFLSNGAVLFKQNYLREVYSIKTKSRSLVAKSQREGHLDKVLVERVKRTTLNLEWSH